MKSTLLMLAGGPLALRGALPIPEAQARDAGVGWRHGLSKLSDLKYQAGFNHFDYVKANAPKGGAASLIVLGSFDNFNLVVGGAKGTLVSGVEFLYDTLMVPALDEVASIYGLLAEAVTYPDDFSSVTYRLRASAKWHDGKPVTPDDVVFSFNAFKKLSPQAAASFRQVTKAEKTAEREVTFHFDGAGNRELPQVVGQLTVLPKHWWEGTDGEGKKRSIGDTTLEPPLGSGP
ncbi:MAG TPA: ABC transporter substrate-binding protein, partial [Pseudolabrys sp.]|nr:ABC transporter substrate-binding protein [Pseudolabrys sp.]